MSRLLFALLFLFAATLSAADLVKNGKAVSVIVIGENPTKSAQLAAYELQYHIAKKTGVTLPIAAKAEKGKLPICVGGMNGFKSQEYLVDIKPGKIILAGCDAQESGKVNYADEKSFPSRWKECATLYAAYDFLEMAGFRWYIPTDIGTTFTPSKNLSIAEKRSAGHLLTVTAIILISILQIRSGLIPTIGTTGIFSISGKRNFTVSVSVSAEN